MNEIMTYRSLKDVVEGEVGAGDLEHVFLEDEVLAPEGLHVGL